ncbi:protein prune homolog 2-like isoform X2 [Haliotis rufescens]|uniref:protein prune homolog 2-like isoform X2 n=1 Tax=Haliotis rufescens TaxID=6454 RepID=UPI00201ED7D6|nr:protein prune homolog 2-like isoform X2 [Haliotis rufescens]
MEDFLRSSRQGLAKVSDYGKVHFVIGNEACDLDSAVSALVYSFYLYKTGTTDCLFVPVLAIPRCQYQLHTEITYLLGRHDIPPDLLTFADDVDLASLAPHLQLTLVDHHVLRTQLSPLDQYVVCVIDHRPVEKHLDKRVSCTIDLVGSCCTLVTEEIARDDTFILDTTVATLLLGTILTDTINMSEAAGKTTARDVAAIDTLKLILPQVDTQALFDGIHQAKTDVSGLSSHDLLKKDVKLVAGASLSIAMCSVMMSSQDLLHKEDVVAALGSFTAENAVDAVVMMLLSTPRGEPHRELAVYSPQRIYRQQIADVLECCSSPNLMLETVSDGPDDIAVFNQGNVQASRKKVMPILKAFLNGEKTPDESVALGTVPFVSGGSSLGQGESQQGERHASSQGLDVLSPDTVDLFHPAASTHSAETSASSEGQLTSPAHLSEQFDALFLGNEEAERGTDLAANENGNESYVNSSAVLSPVGYNKREDVDNTDLLNNFDPYALIPSADNEDNTGDTQRPSELIDNVINTKADDFELTEADVLHPSSGQDLFSSGLESPMDFSPGQNSGQGSKVSSYPVTPPNSFMDNEYSGVAMEHNLPSFNSSEMVERIKAKKASLGADTEGDASTQDFHMDSAQGEQDFTFTPQNSYTDSNMEKHLKETELPSFYNSEMVQRIREKRASLENAVNDTENNQDDLQNKIPWTPHNSYVEGSLDAFTQDNLPSFNNDEMVRKVQEKRASLPSLDENENEAGASGSDDNLSSVAYTPQNGGVEGEEGPKGRYMDTTQATDSTAGASPEMDHACTHNSVPHGNLLDFEISNTASNNSVANLIANEMVSDISGEPAIALQLGRHQVSGHNNTSNVVASAISDQMEKERGMRDSLSRPPYSNGDTDGATIPASDVIKGWHSPATKEDQMSETAMNEVAFTLASELIQNALETFIPHEELSQVAGPSETCTSSEAVGPQASATPATPHPDEVEAGRTPRYLKTLSKSDSNTVSVETEYLPEMDPLHGNMDIVDSGALETDAEREVAESCSFRRISCERSALTDGAEQLEGDTLAVRKVIHIDSDLNMSLDDNSNAQDEEVIGLNVDDSQSKKRIHVNTGDKDKTVDSIEHDESVNTTGEDSVESCLKAGVPHFSDSAGERKEVYMTSAGRISIGVDQDVPVTCPAHNTTQVGYVDAVAAAPDEEVFLLPQHACDPTTLWSSVPTQPCDVNPVDDLACAPRPVSTSTCTSQVSTSSLSSQQEKMKGVELKDEWQDDGFPGMLAEGSGTRDKARPRTLGASEGGRAKKKILPDINLLSDEDASEGDVLPDIDDLETPHDLDTPDDLEDGDLGELEWEKRIKKLKDDTPVLSPDDIDPIPEYTEQEEKHDARHWKTVTVGDKQYKIDLKVIEPYKKVLSHGGYYGDGLNAIILFSGCYLPDRRRKDYNYVMDNLFYYVVHTLEQLVAEDYMIVYFHGATPRRQMPSLSWLKKCYQMIDRRLRKNLKALLLVHPTLWLKTVVMMTKPFISSKFTSKLRFVRTLQELSQLLPMDHVYVPDQVQSFDASLHSRPTLSTPSTPTSDPTSPH